VLLKGGSLRQALIDLANKTRIKSWPGTKSVPYFAGVPTKKKKINKIGAWSWQR
jgi:hypothetical protein